MTDRQERTPLAWALLPLKRYADFGRRAPRAEYWWFVLALAIVGFLAGFSDAYFLHLRIWGIYGPLSLALNLACMVPGLAVLVRRLHDTDTSGWWALVRLPSYAIVAARSSYGSVGALIGKASGILFVAEVLVFLAWFLATLYVFVRLVSDGDAGRNHYGPDPYGDHDELEEVFA